MNKIRNDWEVTQAMREAEQKKKGFYPSYHSLYLCITWDLIIFLVQFLSPPDKIEDARAKAAIKAQIEADKKARAEKFAREKALRDGQPVPDTSSSAGTSSAPASAASVGGVAGKDFKETRLQIRMATGGQPYTISLPSDAGAFSVVFYACCINAN